MASISSETSGEGFMWWAEKEKTFSNKLDNKLYAIAGHIPPHGCETLITFLLYNIDCNKRVQQFYMLRTC